MKKILLMLIFTALTATGLAQNGPRIEFTAVDNTLDFGTISKDTDNGIRRFEFKNAGNAPLIITNVQSTCGCVVPTKPTKPILPGQVDTIEVKYNMIPGPIRKTITVESNAVNYEGGKVSLKIKGEVVVK